MKKTKQEKAITLVALIITIIILIVLAVVAVASINNYDIIGYADRATTKYKEEQSEENGVLQEYNTLVDKYGDKENNEDVDTCSHTSYEESTWYDSEKHYSKKICNDCGNEFDSKEEAHDVPYGGSCIYCGYEVKCTSSDSQHSWGNLSYSAYGNGYHIWFYRCNICEFIWRNDEGYMCEPDATGYCTVCREYVGWNS